MAVEVGDFERFEKIPKFATFLGLVLKIQVTKESIDTILLRLEIVI